jgi:hypothetical protein
MTKRTLMLVVDANFSLTELDKIARYVTTSPDFSSWWNHLPMVFMLETDHSTAEICKHLHAVAPDARFLLTEINLAATEGYLPDISWKWFEMRVPADVA